MIPMRPDMALRAVGAATAGASMVFAGYMLAYGGGQIRVFGMEHLAIFAQPHGAVIGGMLPPAAPAPSDGAVVDMGPTGSVGETVATPQPAARPEIVAARSDRVWLRIDGKIVAAAPGETVAGLGRIGAIVRRDGGWVVLDDNGTTLMTLAGSAKGAALFTRRLIFD
jgi:hypothetical protein